MGYLYDVSYRAGERVGRMLAGVFAWALFKFCSERQIKAFARWFLRKRMKAGHEVTFTYQEMDYLYEVRP